MRDIKELREAKGISRNELADFLGISLSSLGYYERNERIPDANIVARLATFFGVSADYLLELTPYPNVEQRAAIDEKFSALPTKMQAKFSDIQLSLLRAADTFRWASKQVSTVADLFYYLSDDLQKCVDIYIRLVEDNTPETNWETDPGFFVNQFLFGRAQMSQNTSNVINCIYQRGSIGADEILKSREEDSNGLIPKTDN